MTKGLDVHPMHSFKVLAKPLKQNIYEFETIIYKRSYVEEIVHNLVREIDDPTIMHAFASKTPHIVCVSPISININVLNQFKMALVKCDKSR